MSGRNRRKLLFAAATIFALSAVYWLAKTSGTLDVILDGTALQERIATLGLWGPFAVIGMMAGAILISPLPSAPIAVAAGAAYGHFWGTIYVLVGAETGATAAFLIARYVGYDTLHRWFGDRLSTGWVGSQNTLMILVFISRLLPFVSFDLISYAAGLTVLSFWRFAIATAVGIVPASFLLAHFGGEMATGEAERIMVSVAALGAMTAIPVLVHLVRSRFKNRTSKRS